MYVLDARCKPITSSGLVLGKQKLGRSFNFNKQDDVDLTKFSDQTKCRASEARKKLLAQKSSMKSLDQRSKNVMKEC